MTKVLGIALVLIAATAFTANAGSVRTDVLRVAQATTPAAPAAAESAAPVDEAALIAAHKEAGKPVYEDYCAGCHQSNGRGDIGPKLTANGKLANAVQVYRQIVQGGSEMPPFGDTLTPEEILAVGTYIRTTWGNDYGPLTEENIKAQ